jgi:hypothetical protein
MTEMTKMTKMTEMTEIADYSVIIQEVMDLVGLGKSPLASLMGSSGISGGTEKLNERLRYILNNLDEFSTPALMCYLRSSYTSSRRLSNWLPLLDAAKKKGIVRGDDPGIFVGLSCTYTGS